MSAISAARSPVEPIGTIARRRPLDGDWTLTFRATDGPVPDTLPADGADGYLRIPGAVPGAVEIDLMAAGLLPDIYVGDNIRAAWDLEYGDWWYRTEFEVTESDRIADLALVFAGVDTFADVIVNGTVLAVLDNMLIEHEVSIGSAARVGTNELVVHLRSPLAAAERYPLTAHVWQANGSMESLAVRKPAHMYGWDIAPRIVSAGLHRGVELVERAADRITQFHLRTVEIDRARGRADLDLFVETACGTRGRDMVIELEALEPVSGSAFSFDG
jgi:beta-mannosidase